VRFFSVHHFPAYPNTGKAHRGANCFNYTVEPQALRETYLATWNRALAELKQYEPDLIVVSAGFDAYVRDPVGHGQLLTEDFYQLGQSLRALKTPMFSLLEGGYSRDLPKLVLAYLQGLTGMDFLPPYDAAPNHFGDNGALVCLVSLPPDQTEHRASTYTASPDYSIVGDFRELGDVPGGQCAAVSQADRGADWRTGNGDSPGLSGVATDPV
jgi:hypothetical protein